MREYGKPPYTGLRTLTRFSADGRQDFSGPGSDLMKFAPSLCAPCNNRRSQAFDGAWDTFTAYLADNEEAIVANRTIDLAAVYGPTWRTDALDLARYVVKHLVCRIVQELPGPIRLDEELVSFLNGGAFPACLQMDFALDLSVLEMLRLTRSTPAPEDPEAADAGFLRLGPMGVMQDRKTGEWSEPHSGLHYRWLVLHWKVGAATEGVNPFGSSVLQLPASDEMFGPEARQTFTTLRGIRASVFDAADEGTPLSDALRKAGYPDLADQLEKIGEEFQARAATGAP